MVVFGTFLPPKNTRFEMKRPIFNQLAVIRYSSCSEFHGDSHGRLNLISCKLINLAFFGGARKKWGDAAPNQYTGVLQRGAGPIIIAVLPITNCHTQ